MLRLEMFANIVSCFPFQRKTKDRLIFVRDFAFCLFILVDYLQITYADYELSTTLVCEQLSLSLNQLLVGHAAISALVMSRRVWLGTLVNARLPLEAKYSQKAFIEK